MLEIYALRWGIEVYFKEAKQHLGFLKEQTATFASHTASIHLCAIRYLMLMHNKLAGHESRIGDIRSTAALKPIRARPVCTVANR
jgi:IS4 transposase